MTARPTVHEWSGSVGIRQLGETVQVLARHPAAFRAQQRTFPCAGLLLVDWRSTAFWGEWAAEAGSVRIDLVLVLSGRIRCTTPTMSWEAGTGDLYVARHDETMRFTIAEGVHLRMLRLPQRLVPARLLSSDVVRTGPITDSKVGEAFGPAFRSLGDAVVATGAASPFLGLGLRNLALSVLDERATDGESGLDLRVRILRYVDAHLSDPELSPRQIATRFNVSIRWVHYAFNQSGDTLSRYIRVRRVDAVAEEIRASPADARPTSLAVSYGFSGRDHLSRCFRWRYGLTVAQFADELAAGRSPQQIEESEVDVGAEVDEGAPQPA